MRLLICTQTVDKNDPILGFFHRWIEEFAKHCTQVIVICLFEGQHALPSNVKVLSLGKEKGESRMKYLSRLYMYIWRERKHYDAVFVHMNQVYVILAGVLWRLWGKKIGLWYVHKSVTTSLRIATVIVDHVFTTSSESFRIDSSKKMMLGHGIDTDLFVPSAHHTQDILRLLTVGRIAKAKRIDAMIALVEVLHGRGIPVTFSIVGVPVLDADREYERKLRAVVRKKDLEEVVHFEGAIAQNQLPGIYRAADVFLNLSATESMDKAVLEALACGTPVVTSNVAFKGLLGPQGLFVEGADEEILADAVLHAWGMDMASTVEKVRSDHSLSRLIPAIVGILSV